MLGSYVAAAFITPGDLWISAVVLSIPLYFLYELSIVLSWLVFRKRLKQRQEDEAASAAEDAGVVA